MIMKKSLCSLILIFMGFSSVIASNETFISFTDTIPQLVTEYDTIIIFDYDTYEETVKVVESQVFNPEYYLQEKYMKDTITTIDTIATFDPNTGSEKIEIYEMKIPFGVKALLDYEYGKDIPDVDNLQKYLDLCLKKKLN